MPEKKRGGFQDFVVKVLSYLEEIEDGHSELRRGLESLVRHGATMSEERRQEVGETVRTTLQAHQDLLVGLRAEADDAQWMEEELETTP